MKIACVIPWNSPFLWAAPIPAFLNVKAPEGAELRWFMPSGWCSARRKTAGVEQALEWGANLIWFVDADQLVEEDTLTRLYARLKDYGVSAVGAMQPCRGYFPQFKGSKPYQPMCWDEAGQPFTPKEFQAVMYASLNCFLIETEVFERTPRPWFSERFNVTTMARLSSLDQHFTKKLWDSGYRMWVDPSIRPKHMDAMPLDWGMQNRFDDLVEAPRG